MFTILYHEISGHEQIRQARIVSVEPPNEVNGNKKTVWINESEEGSMAINSGTVYVMNDNGKTVATYHLWWPDPTPVTGEGNQQTGKE